MDLDPDVCYRALCTRDARFDGRLFVAVRTTGVYCRPICPARTPKRANVEFHRSAAAAQAAGFRPCLRCRPECSPDLAAWRGTSSTVSRALALIARGALDGEGDVEQLASRLGIGERQLRRLFERHLGASPVAVAQTRRLLFAKQLIHETGMRMVDVALAAGYGSLRRFNDAFRSLYGRPPSSLRRRGTEAARTGGAAITLRLAYVEPYDWDALRAFFAARAIDGVEVVAVGSYRRSIEIGGHHGTIDVRPVPGRSALAATIRFPDVGALPRVVERLRAMFDLVADVRAIGQQLRGDARLEPLVAARPGLRVPGCWDGFELAVRAILGQQVTVAAARGLLGKIVGAHGMPLSGHDGGARSGPTRLFPTPTRLASADLAPLGIPRARAAAVSALAAAVVADPELFSCDRDPQATVVHLRELRGIGEWTAQYVALRALRDPDAFPAADIGLLRAMQGRGGVRPTPRALLAHAEAWRPWRGYAAQHLWAAEGTASALTLGTAGRAADASSAPTRRRIPRDRTRVGARGRAA